MLLVGSAGRLALLRTSICSVRRRITQLNASVCLSSTKHNNDRQQRSGAVNVTPKSTEGSVLEKVFITDRQQQNPTDTVGKVKQKATNAALYTAFIISVVICLGMCRFMYDQIFAPGSAQSVFSKALKLVRQNDECYMLLGGPIVGFGETTARGRRRNVAHNRYIKDGHERIRVMFHLRGQRHDGIATAEMENIDGTWNWRFILVQSSDQAIPSTVVIIDNR